jgi:hypothetical protein
VYKEDIMSKVTVEIAQNINKLYSEDFYSMAEIGVILNLSRGTINNYVWVPRTQGTNKRK